MNKEVELMGKIWKKLAVLLMATMILTGCGGTQAIDDYATNQGTKSAQKKTEETEAKEEVVEVVDDVCEEKKTGIFSKVKNGIKKHGKKVAAVAILGTVGLIGYKLGSRSGDDTNVYYCDDIIADADYSEVNDDTAE